MEYFKKYFSDIEDSAWEQKEVKVLCPFHNDTHPSASINTEKNLFHCWTCDIGYSEEQFAAKINHISTADASKLLNKYNTDNNWEYYKALLWSDVEFLDKVKELGLSEGTISDMSLGLVKDPISNRKLLGIPIFYNKILVDVRRYNIYKYQGIPKCCSNEGAESGWIIPYDLFLNSNEPCYLFEGEKDMLIARELGINAFTMISGARSTPNSSVIGAFKDKDIVLCYDNDKAGREGMIGMYKSLKDIVKSIKYVKIGDVVKEEKEDFYDFVKKYNKNVFDFYSLELHNFDIDSEEEKITIKEALNENKLRTKLESVVTVTSEFQDSYSVPTIVEFDKTDERGSKSETMVAGEKRNWYLEDKNIVQMLELIEVSARDIDIKDKLKSFVGIPSKEPFIKILMKEPKTVYKTTVVDKDIDGSAQSLDLYSFERLDVGGQYIITYKIYPHPTKNQKLVAICKSSRVVHDNRNYVVDKENLKLFQHDGTIQDRLNYLYESAKHHIAKHLNYDIWLMSDLVFNSILDFDYDGVIRGALDVFFLGDTQVGKSETTGELVKLYNFGHFLSLKTSTTVGLIGGSSKVDGSYCNTIGAIPRQHKRLAVLEEFSGARPDFIKTMTDIRSSNELRLSRVSGELVVPCKLRMITISNPLNDENGSPRFLNTFPNGVMPLMELIKSAEDVSRYDGFLLIPKVEKRFNPFEHKLVGTPIPREAYPDKISWVATRQVENVKFDDGVESYIWEKAEELNSIFECNFPLFGTTTDKKLARFCVALASLLVNVDETYENIIVTKEIVDYMVDYLKKNYSSRVFKLDRYAREYRDYSNCTDEDIKCLQDLYAKNATLLNFLNSQSRTTRANLSSVSGLDNQKFSFVFNKLVAKKFIRLSMDNVYPTDKFRKAFNDIDKTFAIDTGSSLIESNTEVDSSNPGVVFINDLEGGDK